MVVAGAANIGVKDRDSVGSRLARSLAVELVFEDRAHRAVVNVPISIAWVAAASRRSAPNGLGQTGNRATAAEIRVSTYSGHYGTRLVSVTPRDGNRRDHPRISKSVLSGRHGRDKGVGIRAEPEPEHPHISRRHPPSPPFVIRHPTTCGAEPRTYSPLLAARRFFVARPGKSRDASYENRGT